MCNRKFKASCKIVASDLHELLQSLQKVSSNKKALKTSHIIHLFLAVKMGAALYKLYGSSFRSHPHPAIFSCTKQFVLLLDIENWCVLSYYFNVLS